MNIINSIIIYDAVDITDWTNNEYFNGYRNKLFLSQQKLNISFSACACWLKYISKNRNQQFEYLLIFVDTMSRLLQFFHKMFYNNNHFSKAPFPSVSIIKSQTVNNLNHIILFLNCNTCLFWLIFESDKYIQK